MKKIPVKELVKRANEVISTKSANEALAAQKNGTAILIDIRDIRELERDGTVADAVHVPRGMAEFWFDEGSPYHKPVLADENKAYLLFCASGWRSALTGRSLHEMGFGNVAHVDGGFTALKDAGAEIVMPAKK